MRGSTTRTKARAHTDSSVSPDKRQTISELATQYFETEVQKLHSVFAACKDDDPDDLKRYTFACNAKRSGFELIKKVAQASAGSVHPFKTEEQRQLTDELVEDARRRLADQFGGAKRIDDEVRHPKDA